MAKFGKDKNKVKNSSRIMLFMVSVFCILCVSLLGLTFAEAGIFWMFPFIVIGSSLWGLLLWFLMKQRIKIENLESTDGAGI